MLKLKRKLNEIISIETPSGERIQIHLIESSRSRATIGVDAPADYKIMRDELVDEHEYETAV